MRLSRQDVDNRVQEVMADGTVTPQEIKLLQNERCTRRGRQRANEYLAASRDLRRWLGYYSPEGIASYEAKATAEALRGNAAVRRFALTHALPEFAPKLSHGALEALAMPYDSPTLRKQVLADGALVDANGNGVLDAADWIVSDGGKLSRVNEVMGEQAWKRLRIDCAVVDAAFALSQSPAKFGGNDFDWARWRSVGDGAFKPRFFMKPSESVRDLFAHPERYEYECATAMVIVYYKAMLDVLGDKRFNEVCRDLQIGPWVMEADLERLFVRRGDSIPISEPPLELGEHTYVKNFDVSPEGREAGWQGENVIYVGDGLYYGHPFGIVDSQEIRSALDGQRNQGSTQPSSFVNFSIVIGTDLIGL